MADLAERLTGEGLDPSTVRGHLAPLKAIYRCAISRDLIAVNPTVGVDLPMPRGRRERIASPAETELLLAAVPDGDRAVWATAMCAGLRAGELQALKWSDVDLASGVIRVERSYDRIEGADGSTRSRSGRRRLPILAALRDDLVELRMSTSGEGLVFAAQRVERFPFVGPLRACLQGLAGRGTDTDPAA